MYGFTASVPTWPRMMAWPSGVACAASDMATTPAPPGLFSTNTVWPSCLVSSAATERATISDVPPGAKGTRKRIGLEGQDDCAHTHGSASAAPAPTTKVRRCNTEVLFIV